MAQKHPTSYVYDNETGLYYLQSRYYDPEMGRFLNADSYTSTGQGLIGNNMFAYCRNNPVRRIDISGLMDDDADKVCIDEVDPEDDLFGAGSPGGYGSSSMPTVGTGGGGGSALNSSGTGTTGHSYTAPHGGGGVTRSISVNGTVVTFGHGGRHVSGNIQSLENAIAHDVVHQQLSSTQSTSFDLTFEGTNYTYRAIDLGDRINVGTYFYK